MKAAIPAKKYAVAYRWNNETDANNIWPIEYFDTIQECKDYIRKAKKLPGRTMLVAKWD